MRTGPALRQLHSHRSIHDAAYQEASEMTRVLEGLVRSGDHGRALEVAYVLVEQWETRTLRHAAAEEEGLYLEALQDNPSLSETIVQLKRDHDLLRTLLASIQTELGQTGHISADVLHRFYALLAVVQFHSREEERHLIAKDGQNVP